MCDASAPVEGGMTWLHWFTDGKLVVIAASKWQHGDLAGYTPQGFFTRRSGKLAGRREKDADEVYEWVQHIDSERLAEMLSRRELQHLGEFAVPSCLLLDPPQAS